MNNRPPLVNLLLHSSHGRYTLSLSLFLSVIWRTSLLRRVNQRHSYAPPLLLQLWNRRLFLLRRLGSYMNIIINNIICQSLSSLSLLWRPEWQSALS